MSSKPKQTKEPGITDTIVRMILGAVDSNLSVQLMALSHRRHLCIHLHEGNDEYSCQCEKVPLPILCAPKLLFLCRFYKADKTRPLWEVKNDKTGENIAHLGRHHLG